MEGNHAIWQQCNAQARAWTSRIDTAVCEARPVVLQFQGETQETL